jgi:hypothetical protein
MLDLSNIGPPKKAWVGEGSEQNCTLTRVINVSFKVNPIRRSALNFVMRIRGQSRRSWDYDKVRPVVPWSKRNMGPPKNCNGWAWVGEGSEQKLYLNVSY